MKCRETAIHIHGVQVVGGSNPLAPTIDFKELYFFKRSRRDAAFLFT